MSQQSEFLQQYAAQVREIIRELESWSHLPPATLIHQPQIGKWSAAQCLQHLNVYCDYYIPAMKDAIEKSKNGQGFSLKSGIIGSYFVKLMKLDQENKVAKPMKSPKNAIPSETPDAQAEIKTFLRHQQELLDLLDRAENTDINLVRIPTSLTKLIRMRLGDTFAFFIEHEKRHIAQGRKAISTELRP